MNETISSIPYCQDPTDPTKMIIDISGLRYIYSCEGTNDRKRMYVNTWKTKCKYIYIIHVKHIPFSILITTDFKYSYHKLSS